MPGISVPIPYDATVLSSTSKLLNIGQTNLLPVYNRPNMVIDRGDGSHLWDVDGNEYIDFSSGLSVCNLGYRHPIIMEAMIRQTEKIWHTTNLYHSEPVILLAEYLNKHTFSDYVFFWNSAIAAYEGAIQAAKKYSRVKHLSHHKEKTIVLSSIQHNPNHRLNTSNNIIYYPFHEIETIESIFSDSVNAVICGLVDGGGHGACMDNEYFQKIRHLCNQHGALLIVDEIATAIGRTGRFFGHEWFDAQPDMVIVAHGLSAGLPIGALLLSKEVGLVMECGDFVSALGGNPLSTFVALESMEIINDERFLKKVVEKEKYLREQIFKLNQDCPLFGEIYGKGLLLVAPFIYDKCSVQRFSELCAKYGVLLLPSGERCISFSPPLIIQCDEIDECMERIRKLIAKTFL